MTEEELRAAVYTSFIEEAANRIIEKLAKIQKRALVVCTGSALAFPEWMYSLKELKLNGFEFDLFLSYGAVQALDTQKIENEVDFGEVWYGESDKLPEHLVSPYYTVIVPSLTISSASKLASCIADTPSTRMIMTAMMQGKNVIIATNGCCPDNIRRIAKGYCLTGPLKETLRKNITLIRSFGATLTTAKALSHKVLSVIGGNQDTGQREECDISGTIYFDKRILTRQDLTAVPRGAKITLAEKCQITQLASDIARERGVDIVRK